VLPSEETRQTKAGKRIRLREPISRMTLKQRR
jgi:hypothetical protein